MHSVQQYFRWAYIRRCTSVFQNIEYFANKWYVAVSVVTFLILQAQTFHLKFHRSRS